MIKFRATAKADYHRCKGYHYALREEALRQTCREEDRC
jgi:hypothetical protein